MKRPSSRHVIRSGPLEGKRIELAPTEGIEAFSGIADEFMLRIFDLEPEDYLITDESSLHDFETLVTNLDDVYERICAAYNLDVSDVRGGNLMEIFRRLRELSRDESHAHGPNSSG